MVALAHTNQIIIQRHGLPTKYIRQLHFLLFYHLFFSVFYTWYVMNFGGDSLGYWLISTMEQVKINDPSWMKYFGEGTTFIIWLTFIPSKALGLSYITGNILFGFLGFIGIRYIYVLVAVHFPVNHHVLGIPLFPVIFFFPNLHFWSSGVGKDTVCFWAMAWFLFALQNIKDRWWQIAVSFFFVYMTRPHIGLALIISTSLAVLLGSEIKRQYKLPLAALAIVVALMVSSNTLDALKINDFSIETLEVFSEEKSGHLNSERVGSRINLSEYPWPIRLFSYLFRPLFFDAHNVMAFLSSFENITYLWLSFFIYRNWSPEAIRDMPLFIKAAMITFLPVTLALMNSLSNSGIAMRMKNMLMIYFLLFCFYLIAYQKKLRYTRAMDRIRYYSRRQEIIKAKARNRVDDVKNVD